MRRLEPPTLATRLAIGGLVWLALSVLSAILAERVLADAWAVERDPALWHEPIYAVVLAFFGAPILVACLRARMFAKSILAMTACYVPMALTAPLNLFLIRFLCISVAGTMLIWEYYGPASSE